MPELLPHSRSIRRSLKNFGMKVTAVSLGVPFYYSESQLDLHSSSRAVRESTLRYVRRSVDFASEIEADLVYVCSMSRVPRFERAELIGHLTNSIADCADYAKAVGVSFGVEPFPTGELPTIGQVNDLIKEAMSENLGVVVDTGHAAISGEPLARAVRDSENIMHVHVNNNDGVADLHWPPQKGKLTRRDFETLFIELRNHEYHGKVSIELSKPRPVVSTVSDSRLFVQKIMERVNL